MAIFNVNKDEAKGKLRLSDPVHLLATGFGSGLAPLMPGTVGTLAAIPFYLLLISQSVAWLLAAVLIGIVAGVAICGKTAKDMGVHDAGCIVWDEFVGFWITMLLVPSDDWRLILAGFILFRIFDMLKPFPISWLDKNVDGGLGIMLDDILAGFIAMLCLWQLAPWLQSL
ncbi:MAG: phosphatidylglycerophosphatase A [Vibrionaceae bacterium]